MGVVSAWHAWAAQGQRPERPSPHLRLPCRASVCPQLHVGLALCGQRAGQRAKQQASPYPTQCLGVAFSLSVTRPGLASQVHTQLGPTQGSSTSVYSAQTRLHVVTHGLQNGLPLRFPSLGNLPLAPRPPSPRRLPRFLLPAELFQGVGSAHTPVRSLNRRLWCLRRPRSEPY